ncbi:helix-turn-helix domain-containing protein [Paenibacillus qinlingensis]|uniref:helix-turn-helix domain-containing protein n=1 Tax=Paenibacillus qinlingensis TaxID=1837343 RepID=UPI0037C721A1
MLSHKVEQRIHAEYRYLATTDCSVERIAELVGYQSVTAFQDLFKKATGHAPGNYRKLL